MEVLEVIHPGALTTVQDPRRYGSQRYTVPVSGAMDKFSLKVANLLRQWFPEKDPPLLSR